ncbi:DEAD/DEAH box helicase [Imhoffiella purpurea]|uniref:ATP-dependent RNA helicase RhlE n=1 Tax=Imhoffiella purpurea TaxID=1249627 RepID=W9V401_9GAMM|nr:DEAD/DEAH box helicase [Imhoffiella purpurea]EXJ14064.1 ATP-dependent RNA helicase RhlE [Imhoffiella purpurea]
MSFAELGLSAELLRAVAAQGYTHPTPIQCQAIPAVLSGRDVLAGAQTGTGKTAAFTLPMLQRLSAAQPAQSGRRPRRPRALVLTPTRELAAQVGESVRLYGQHLPLRSLQIFGGVGMGPQVEQLRRGVDILVATPGRLLDHQGQGNVDFGGIEILVLDEADRMLDMGFIHDIRRIIKLLPRQRQNLLFSATYSREIEQLATGLLQDPQRIEVARRNTAAETVSQRVHPVAKEQKRALLSHLIHRGGWEQVLVFTRTKHGANRLAQQLITDGITAAAIHGNKSQGARTRALADFKNGAVRTLVATDIAARGLDIDRLPHVVNYELPNVPEDYVHRIGRTGRAGSEGTAVSLVGPDERGMLAGIERLLGRRIESEKIEGFESVVPDAQSERPVRDEMPGRRQSAPSGGQRAHQGRSSSGRRASTASESGGPNGRHARKRPSNNGSGGGRRSARTSNAQGSGRTRG